MYGYAGGYPVNFSDPFGLCPPVDANQDDCQSDSTGIQKQAYCPTGTRGTPPNCTSVATGQPTSASCPNVSGQEWDLGQQAIQGSKQSGLEEGFGITGSGVVPTTGPTFVRTPASITALAGWPAGTTTLVHSHPSGRGISPGDVATANAGRIRVVSAGVGTNRYGSAARGKTPVTCNTPSRPATP